MRRRIPDALRAFFETESAGGFVLVAACLIALICANSPFQSEYLNFWHPKIAFVNEGLMSIFFFLVGLEIKREFLHGELRNRKAAALPVIAAIGGMITPAIIYLAINSNGDAQKAWAVPMPTDIALAIGALALLGSRIDTSLKIFLLTLAIADDLGSLAVLGIFYSHSISLTKVASTFGAVILAWLLPTSKKLPIDSLIRSIHPLTSFLVIPIFALANVGINIPLASLSSLFSSPVTYGIILARVIGKIIGISVFAWLSVKIGIAKLPVGVSFDQIVGIAALAGMGLTVSLFLAEIAVKSSQVLSEVKLGLILAAIISAVLGLSILRRVTS
jgi:NhaA family Na+:H+ antiporter